MIKHTTSKGYQIKKNILVAIILNPGYRFKLYLKRKKKRKGIRHVWDMGRVA